MIRNENAPGAIIRLKDSRTRQMLFGANGQITWQKSHIELDLEEEIYLFLDHTEVRLRIEPISCLNSKL